MYNVGQEAQQIHEHTPCSIQQLGLQLSNSELTILILTPDWNRSKQSSCHERCIIVHISFSVRSALLSTDAIQSILLATSSNRFILSHFAFVN